MDMPFEDTSSSFAAMSRAWSQAAAKVAPDVLGLPEILMSRLDELKASAHLDEKSLNATVEDAVKLVVKRGNKDSAKQLDNQLRRYVYEYLLALDAVIAKPPEPEMAHSDPPQAEPAQHAQAADVDMPPLASVAPKEGFHLTDEVGVVKQVHTVESPIEEIAAAEPVSEALPVVEEVVAPPEEIVAQPVEAESWDADPAIESFDLKSLPFEETSEDGMDGMAFETATVVDLPKVESSPIPEVQPEPEQIPAPAIPENAIPQHASATEWNVRRAAGHSQQAVVPQVETYDPTEAEITMRHDIEKLLKRKKIELAAARVRRAIKTYPTSFMAEVALDMGDRMRILGKSRAATNCYLAAIKCWPGYEEPFERLAELAMLKRDSGLAAAFFEQMAELRRARGDLQGTLRCYRKIVTIAPQRQDISAAMLRMKSAGEI